MSSTTMCGHLTTLISMHTAYVYVVGQSSAAVIHGCGETIISMTVVWHFHSAFQPFCVTRSWFCFVLLHKKATLTLIICSAVMNQISCIFIEKYFRFGMMDNGRITTLNRRNQGFMGSGFDFLFFFLKILYIFFCAIHFLIFLFIVFLFLIFYAVFSTVVTKWRTFSEKQL